MGTKTLPLLCGSAFVVLAGAGVVDCGGWLAIGAALGGCVSLAGSALLSAFLATEAVSTLALVSAVTAGLALSALAGSETGATSFFASGATDVVISCGTFAAADVLAVGLAVWGVLSGAALAADPVAFVGAFAVVLVLEAAEDAREVEFCVALSPPVLGVFAFATLKTFPILTVCQLFLQS
jgi:hypothetical protein